MKINLLLRISIIWTLVVALVLNSCSEFYNSDKFDRDIWLSNNNVNNIENPRAKMTNDLLKNYLKPGIHRDSILILLGKPYLDHVENRLQKGINIPDSLSLTDSINFRKENRDKALKNLNAWYHSNSQPDTLMLYPVGWSIIDPNFLVIKFGPNKTAYEFWIEQH